MPDGSARELPAGATAADLAASIGSRLAKAAVIAVVNGEQRDLATPLADGDEVAIVTADSDAGLFTIRHSTAHVLAQAVLRPVPRRHVRHRPARRGRLLLRLRAARTGGTFTDDDLERIDARMREIIKETSPSCRDELTADEALELFADQPYKLEIIDGAATDPTSATSATEPVRTYENPPPAPKATRRSTATPASSTCAAVRTCPSPAGTSATSS